MSIEIYVNGKPKIIPTAKKEGFFDSVKQSAKFYFGKFKQERNFRDMLQNTVKPFDKELYKIVILAMGKSEKKQIMTAGNILQLALDSDSFRFDADITLQNGLRMVFNQRKSIITFDFNKYREVKEMRLSEAKKKKKKNLLVSKNFTDGTECISVESDDGRTIIAAGHSTVYENMDVIQIVLKNLDGSMQADETEVKNSSDALYIVRKLLKYLDDQPRFIEKAVQMGLKISNISDFYDPVEFRRMIPSLHWGLEPYPDPMLEPYHGGRPPRPPHRDRRDLPVNGISLPHGSLDAPGKVPGSVDVPAPEAPPAMPENSVFVSPNGKLGLIIKRKKGRK